MIAQQAGLSWEPAVRDLVPFARDVETNASA